MSEPSSAERNKYRARLFAGLFGAWIKTETTIDFWDENNGGDMLASMLEAFLEGGEQK
jgi:hypothetical protein